MVSKRAGRHPVTEFFPYYSLRHGEEASRKGHYWLAHRDEELADAAAGHEYSLTLVDRDFSPLKLDGHAVAPVAGHVLSGVVQA